MIAEIHHKISSSGSNLSERLEDKLTGDVFGHLRYLPYEIGLKKVLKACWFPPEQKASLQAVLNEVEEFEYQFWPRHKEGEPDLILDSKEAVILIEVKYHSGLSSDDEIQDPELSRNQLAREAQILKRIKRDRKAFLIFLALKNEAAGIYSQTVEKNQIDKDVAFGYLSWSDVLDALLVVEEGMNFPYHLIQADIIDLLKKKGFDRFKDFNIESETISNHAFIFSETGKHKFSFNTNQTININHYEYGKKRS